MTDNTLPSKKFYFGIYNFKTLEHGGSCSANDKATLYKAIFNYESGPRYCSLNIAVATFFDIATGEFKIYYLKRGY